MDWESILTKKQKQRLIREAVKALKKLLNSPVRKDLIGVVKLGKYQTGGSCFHYGTLELKKDGLWETTGYHDGMCFDGSLPGSYCNDPRRVKWSNFKRIVEEYKLTPEKLEKIRSSIEK